jgi:hypothetical protein
MHSPRWRTLALGTALALAGTLLLPATAATATPTQAQPARDYCVVNAVSAEDPPDTVSTIKCFPTSPAADAYAHSPEFTQHFTDQITTLDNVGSGPYVIADLYDYAGYDPSGGVLHVWGSYPCSVNYNTADYYLRDLRINGTGWNDRITSFRTYNRCDLRLFEHIDFGGAEFPEGGWGDYSANLGWYGWSNRASSIWFS